MEIFQSGFIIFKTIMYVLVAALLGGIIYVLRKSLNFRPRFSLQEMKKKRILTAKNAVFAEKWSEIEKRAAVDLPEAAKIAIIEADKFVDGVLKKIGLPGEHMADRLDNLPTDEMRSLDALWRAHRLRNNIVHTPGFEVSPVEAGHAIENYKAFLRELGIL